MIYLEWNDFVLGNSGSIKTPKDRFDLQREKRAVRRELVEQYGDRFEAMEVSALGDVVVWTTSKVWCVRKEIGIEKLMWLPRNPPSAASSGES
jgi:hypothetical protein